MQLLSTICVSGSLLPKYIIHICTVCIFLCSAYLLSAQEDAFAGFDAQTLERANTAIDLPYLSTEEERVFLFMNLARMDGPNFVDHILKPYLKENGIRRGPYVQSLMDDLENAVPLEPVSPQKDLSEAAREHARYTGGTGRIGHTSRNGKSFEERLGYLSEVYSFVGEGCDYGYANAIDIVIDLLIDEGIEDVGHRKTLLHPKYLYAGVSIGPHSKYLHTCVIDLGGEMNGDRAASPGF